MFFLTFFLVHVFLILAISLIPLRSILPSSLLKISTPIHPQLRPHLTPSSYCNKKCESHVLVRYLLIRFYFVLTMYTVSFHDRNACNYVHLLFLPAMESIIIPSQTLKCPEMAPPQNTSNKDKEGQVFLVLVSVHPLTSRDLDQGDRRDHWIVVIDVAGESNDDELMYSFLFPFHTSAQTYSVAGNFILVPIQHQEWCIISLLDFIAINPRISSWISFQ